MKGIVGVSADYLQPGNVVEGQRGYRVKIIRKVDLAAARAMAERLGDTSFTPVEGEHFYEVEVLKLANVSMN